MLHLIGKITELQSALSELLPMKEEFKKKLDDKFRLEFSYNSNHLEGNTLTYGETKLLLIFGKTEGNHDKREYDEIEAHDVAFKLIQG
ncbi:MAG: Fic family protein, partial [Chitinophagaceae bacterium]